MLATLKTLWNLENLILDILFNLGPHRLFRKAFVLFWERLWPENHALISKNPKRPKEPANLI